MLPLLQSLFGLFCFTALAWLLAERRVRPEARLVAAGLGMQLVLGLLLLKAPLFREGFVLLNELVLALSAATRAGTSFVFGYLGGADAPFAAAEDGGSRFVLAFQALPLVLVIGALSALLFHWGVLQWLVRGFSWLLQRVLGIGGAVGVGTAANVFVGMVEAPLLVRPYLARMSRSELFVLMTCGMATVAGTMMVLYASILGDLIPGALGHILSASVISAPAAVLVARLMVPETAEATAGDLAVASEAASAMDAVTRGTLQALQLFLNIIALLLVLVALVHLANQALGLLPAVAGEALSLERILGWLMAPVVWLMGVPWSEAVTAGSLMGVKTILNEFLAYMQLAELGSEGLSERSRLIMTYALCGFANLGSLGIMLGGFSALVPERRAEVAALGMRSIVAGTLATCMTGAVVGLIGG